MSEEDLFGYEHRIVEEAEIILKSGSITDERAAGLYKDLLVQYKKLFKQTKRLIRAGDRMQNDLSKLNEQLRLSEEKYRNIFENATEGIFRSRIDGSYIEVNPAMARIFRYESPAQMVDGEPRNEDGRLPEEERDRLLTCIDAHGRVQNYQMEMRRRDGDPFWVEISARCIKDHKGDITHIEGLLSDITLRKRLHEELEELATTDSLTGLCNRRSFLDILNREFHRARDEDRPLSLMMIDADHFKSINDTYGHDMGDRVLRRLSQICRQMIREGDTIGRLGGEEFAVVLPDIDLEQACHVAERLRQAVAKTVYTNNGQEPGITVSIGVSTIGETTKSGESLIVWADQALYQAKRKNRNKVCFYEMTG